MTPAALEAIHRAGVIPVVILDDPSLAVPLTRALAEGGIPLVEFTLRSSAAFEVLRTAVRGVPDALVGAGTVLNLSQAKRAVDAGAKFVVSPGLDPAIVRYCLARKIAVLPGACTPTEIQAASLLGLDAVKFFPSEVLGGLKTLKAMAAPFPAMRFVPTGGIGPKNLGEYLACPAVLACGGTWLADERSVRSGDWESVRRTAAEAVATVTSLKRKAQA